MMAPPTFHYGDYVRIREDATFENSLEQAELEMLRDERAVGCVANSVGSSGKVHGGVSVNFYTPFQSGGILVFAPSELEFHAKGDKP